MDETQRRKLGAKEFLQKNKKLGFGLLSLFISFFILYFSFVFFYAHMAPPTSSEVGTGNEPETVSGFFEDLLPVFTPGEQTKTELDNDFLSNFNNPNLTGVIDSGENTGLVEPKVIQIENKPIIGYTVFDKPVSIVNYIKNKPRICSEKMEVLLKKDEKSTSVLTFQNTLRSMEGFEKTPDTGVLDTETREQIYVLQKRYADILYKNKEDKTPTRLMDVATVHFLNLLCGFDKENKDDFVQIPTLRYVLKENRQIYDYNTDNKEKIALEAKLATNTEEVTFSKKGDLAVFRKEINGSVDTVFYNIRTKSVTHLENNITTLDFNNNDMLVYGIPGFQGMTIKSYDHLKNKITRIAALPLNDWNIYTISNSEIGISTKPSAYAESIFMILNTDTKKLRQVAGPLLGLGLQKTSLSDFVILSLGSKGTTKTLLLNNKTRAIGDFGIRTFAEKCSQNIFANGIFCAVPRNLSENFVYPDDWYKGKVQTDDVIVYKTLSGTTTKIISNLENRPISVVNLNVNKNGIFFIDEKSLNLYSLEL